MTDLNLSSSHRTTTLTRGSFWHERTLPSWARRLLVIGALGVVWQIAAIWQDNAIMFPGLGEIFSALIQSIQHDNLLGAAWVSLTVLLKGYALAIVLALVLVSLAASSGFFRDMLQTLTAMMNPLPAIALLPLALLWFGISEASLLFVLCHSVLWPLSLAVLTGFESVPETQRLVGRNYGLRGPSFVLQILIPGALPSLISGLKIGWAFAWRTLIAAELVFGVTSSGEGGLGWFIYLNRNELFTDRVFAGLFVVVAIGLLVEVVIFRNLENLTIRRWGMQK